jgi:hypothetical protein
VFVVLAFAGVVVALDRATGPQAATTMVAALPAAGPDRPARIRAVRRQAARLGATMVIFVGRVAAPEPPSPTAVSPTPPPTATPAQPAKSNPGTTKTTRPGNHVPVREPDAKEPPVPVATDGPAAGLADYLVVDRVEGPRVVIAALAADLRVIDETGAELRPGRPPQASAGVLIGWTLVALLLGVVLDPREYWRRTAAFIAPPPPRNDPEPHDDRESGSSEHMDEQERDEPPRPQRSGLDILSAYTRPSPGGGGPPPRQCPHCGAFGVIRHNHAGDHHCPTCSHGWHAPPDGPWPAVVVSPRRQHSA